jgi:hypothetical protein
MTSFIVQCSLRVPSRRDLDQRETKENKVIVFLYLRQLGTAMTVFSIGSFLLHAQTARQSEAELVAGWVAGK